MIPRRYLKAWEHQAPWPYEEQVEQDLILSRVLVALFSDHYLRDNLAFRGGTALYKLFIKPAPRYSEDIDLVQIKPGPIKPILKRIGEQITFFEESRRVKQKAHNNTILYRFSSETQPEVRLRLKIEINCREHFSVLGWSSRPFTMENGWFAGKASLTTYSLSELLGTKLRALYQRKKGRDLFDLYYIAQQEVLSYEEIIYCFRAYLRRNREQVPTQKQFLRNLEEKMSSEIFTGDTEGLLVPGLNYRPQEAFSWLSEKLLPYW